MKTQDFIARCVRDIENGETLPKKYNSSVMVDGDTIYSYGYHYPLLFRVEDTSGRKLWVLNNGGYSATTRKHISWAHSHADVLAPIGGTSGFFATKLDKESALFALRQQKAHIERDMESKKRKDTAVYRSLERELERVNEYITKLK